MMTEPSDAGPLQEFKEQLAEFIAREKELAKAELVPAAKSAGIGAGLFAGAGVFALHALWMLLLCLALGVGWFLTSFTALSPWGGFTLGFLLTAILSLIVAFILIKVGQLNMGKVKSPDATIEEARATISSLVDAAAGRRPERLAVVEVEPPTAPEASGAA